MRRQQEGLKDPCLGGVLEAEGVAIWAGEIQPHIQVILTKARQGSAPRRKGAVTYLRPGERELQRGCGRPGFYRPPGNPMGSFLLYIWKESDRQHKLRSRSFLTFFGRCQGKGIYRNEQGP